jgi:hypothetical protein
MNRWRRVVRITALALLSCLWNGCGKVDTTPVEVIATPQKITAPKAKFDSSSRGYTNWWLEWSKEVHVGGYQKAGRKDARWDEPVIEALKDYAYTRVYQKHPGGNPPEYFYDQLKQAVNAGCDDPFVFYLYYRIANPPASAKPDTASEYARLAAGMDAGAYSPFLKFFVNLRTAQAWRAAFTNQVPEVNQFRRAAMNHLDQALQTEVIPAGAASDACLELYRVIQSNYKQRYDFYANAERVLFSRWGKEAFPYLLKGKFYVDYAWEARGGGYADKVTREGWRLFNKRMKVAEAALDKAWKIDPSLPQTPLAFLRVELGQGRGRQRMETWYERAIQFPQDRYDAVDLKLWYLQPRWYGSEEECLGFAREILKSDRFQGHVPLLMYSTHESLAAYFKDVRPDYWKEPQVWPDIKASFERYFALNGDDTSWRHNYVMCAWRCAQWATLAEEIPKLKWVNYDYFGGRQAFEQMKERARVMAAANN